MMCGKVEKTRNTVEIIAKNGLSLGIQLKQNCPLSFSQGEYLWRQPCEQLGNGLRCKMAKYRKVLILQENQMSKT